MKRWPFSFSPFAPLSTFCFPFSFNVFVLEESCRTSFIFTPPSQEPLCSPGSDVSPLSAAVFCSALLPVDVWVRACARVRMWYWFRQKQRKEKCIDARTGALKRLPMMLLLLNCVFQDWSPGVANKWPSPEDLWTHRGALIEKSLALSHPSITSIPNPSVPPSSLTPNLVCCLCFPQRQLPFLHQTLLLLCFLSSSNACLLNLQVKPDRV